MISNPKVNISSIAITINMGSYGDEYKGTAHLLEHGVFLDSKKY